jgi:hypothetical protein
MGDIHAARAAYEAAKKDSRAIADCARRNLGRSIQDARRQAIPQDDIAKQLKLTRERVRNFQRDYELAKDEDELPTTAELTQTLMRTLKVLMGSGLTSDEIETAVEQALKTPATDEQALKTPATE